MSVSLTARRLIARPWLEAGGSEQGERSSVASSPVRCGFGATGPFATSGRPRGGTPRHFFCCQLGRNRRSGLVWLGRDAPAGPTAVGAGYSCTTRTLSLPRGPDGSWPLSGAPPCFPSGTFPIYGRSPESQRPFRGRALSGSLAGSPRGGSWSRGVQARSGPAVYPERQAGARRSGGPQRRAQVESPRGVSPRGALRTVLEPLSSHGSSYAAASHRDAALPESSKSSRRRLFRHSGPHRPLPSL